jgi:hypothetical protein
VIESAREKQKIKKNRAGEVEWGVSRGGRRQVVQTQGRPY